VPEVIIKNSIKDFSKEKWNNCFQNIIENYDYLLATEEANIQGFNFFYIAVVEKEKIVAATSAFITHYSLDSTVQGILKKILLNIKKIFPNFLSFKLACIGSIETEINYLGFYPGIKEENKKEYLNKILNSFEQFIKEKNINLLGVKDVPSSEEYLWKDIMLSLNYKYMNGLPTAVLEVNFKDINEYLDSLSKGTKINMKRKLKTKELITINTIENLQQLNGLINLYYETKNRSELQFGELTEEYFKGIFKYMKENAIYSVFLAEGKIIGFNFALFNKDIFIDKFICTKSYEGRKYNLYFINWLRNLEYCIKNNIKIYQTGQGAYKEKIRLKSKLLNNTYYFKHKIKWIDKILKFISPLLEIKIPKE